MEGFNKTPKVALVLLIVMLVVGMFVGHVLIEGKNANNESPDTTSIPTTKVTTPTTEYTTTPSTEPSTEASEPTADPTIDSPPTTPEITFTDVNETVYATGAVNVRSGPSAESEKVGSLNRGDSIKRVAVCDNGWSRVEYNGQPAYVYTSYLSTTKPSDNTESNGNGTGSGNSNVVATGRTPGVIPPGYSAAELISSVDWSTYVGPADISTGLSWDGKSPIIYYYTDGTSGTTPKDGAIFEQEPGIVVTYEVYHDASGRTDGDICKFCGKEVSLKINQNASQYCEHYSSSCYCSICGAWVKAYTCHDCIDNSGNTTYCGKCGKQSGDGSNGTCVRWSFGDGDKICPRCQATVPSHTCHTCGVPIDMSLPGTVVNSPEQLTAAHKEYLRGYAKSVSEGAYGGKANETFVSIYAFVLTDNTAISSKSKCVCFFIFTSEKEYSETPVYHTGEFYDISILDNGTLSFSAKAEEITFYKDEVAAVEAYKKIGHTITKIS